MRLGSLKRYLQLNKVQKKKYNYDLAVEREKTGGVALPDPDGTEYKLLFTDYYHKFKP